MEWRNFTQNIDWFNQIYTRGQPDTYRFEGSGVVTDFSDFSPWGGAIFFNQNLAWNFSTTETSDIDHTDFLSIAMHELGHILGLGYLSQTSTWYSQIQNSRFQGALAIESNGGSAPRISGDYAHWSPSISDNRTIAIFRPPTWRSAGANHDP